MARSTSSAITPTRATTRFSSSGDVPNLSDQ
jgi:hypothetical protein